jgi:hypothetical protein
MVLSSMLVKGRRAVFFSNRLTHRPERGPELHAEKLRLFPRREVTTLVDLVEINEVATGAPPQLFGAR